MASEHPIGRVLYISRLVRGADFNTVRQIVATSRRHNPERGLTGVLLFDGERFSQLIEGPAGAVQTLMASIEADPRHTHVRTLLAEAGATVRPAMRTWVSGYCEANALEAFERDPTVTGRAALDAFNALLTESDLE